jgi:hypothetical protein
VIQILEHKAFFISSMGFFIPRTKLWTLCKSGMFLKLQMLSSAFTPNFQVLSHPISSQNFKFFIPSAFGIKNPLLEIKNPMLESKIACTQMRNLVPRIKKSHT